MVLQVLLLFVLLFVLLFLLLSVLLFVLLSALCYHKVRVGSFNFQTIPGGREGLIREAFMFGWGMEHG